ncbi:MAG: hypothetical protein Q8N30_11430 [Methylococcales bacterium]|nr:hypothetical protein [Methylococcales bacterium]
MNKNNLTKGLFTALLLVSSVVSADEKYPAADFQPSVVYQSDDVKNGSSTKAAVKPAAPVAAEVKTEVDSKYPAADFQPKVVYSDDNYKHNKTLPASASKNTSASSAVSVMEDASDESVTTTQTKKEDSSATYLLGLVGLAAVGFFLFRQQATPATAKAKKASVAPASTKTAATTGVGKYINKVSGTGVSRYVDNQVKTAKSATSVARYVAQQTLADKARAAEEAEKKATGVEKYMRNRG